MKYAVLSDIHANLEALTIVLNDIDANRVDKIACLGDIVGYGANPNECCELIFQRVSYHIIGNHDRAGIDLNESRYFNPYAKEAAQWTHHTLEQKHKDHFLTLQDIEVVNNDFVIVHGAITHANDYILSNNQADENFQLLKEHYPDIQLCFYGHSHIKCIWGSEKKFTGDPFSYELAEQDQQYLINPGSVGQPRDGDPKASYIIYDTELKKITYRLLEYDFEKTMTAIIAAGLPAYLAQRLEHGH